MMAKSSAPVIKRLIYTVKQARQQLGGMSKGVFYKEKNAGRLRTFKVGGRTYITDDALREYIGQCENQLG